MHAGASLFRISRTSHRIFRTSVPRIDSLELAEGEDKKQDCEGSQFHCGLRRSSHPVSHDV
jgi:hypothetical protein